RHAPQSPGPAYPRRLVRRAVPDRSARAARDATRGWRAPKRRDPDSLTPGFSWDETGGHVLAGFGRFVPSRGRMVPIRTRSAPELPEVVRLFRGTKIVRTGGTLDPGLVLPGARVHADRVAGFDEDRDRDDEARLGRGGLPGARLR